MKHKSPVPLRMCIACREMKSKGELIRVVKSAQGEVDIDVKGKSPGRGTYVCKSTTCIEGAKKHKKLERALKMAVADEVYEKLLMSI